MENPKIKSEIMGEMDQAIPNEEASDSGSQDLFAEDLHVVKVQQKQKNNVALQRFLLSIPFQIFITILTVFSLFSDDVRIIAFEKNADLGFDIISLIMIAAFLIEIILSCIAYNDYLFSFFFFLDLISAISIALDVGILTDLIENSSTYSISRVAAQSRTTRVATRVVRIVKLFRIIRVMKLYKTAVRAEQIKEELKRKKLEKNRAKIKVLQAKKTLALTDSNGFKMTGNMKDMEMTKAGMVLQGSPSQQMNMMNSAVQTRPQEAENPLEREQEDLQINQIQDKESKISSFLSDMTMKKVIVVVLLLMFLVPLFDQDNYVVKQTSIEFVNSDIGQLLTNPVMPTNQIIAFANKVIEDHIQSSDYIIQFATPFVEFPSYKHSVFGNQRNEDVEICLVTINTTAIMALRPELTLRSGDDGSSDISAILSIQDYNRKDSWFSIARTLFVCIIMVVLLHYFSEDINGLIVEPIERMMKEVREMAQNPEASSMTIMKDTQYETAIVHNAIVKIGALLSLVFGSAGAQIIGHNIMKEGDMDPLLGGKKKAAIFGFCDIHKFTEVTELLQEDIMLFVNTISQLIHSSVFRYGGSANKNIGEAFLLVWNVPDHCYDLNQETNHIEWVKRRYISILADFSVLSFIKAIVKINKDPTVLEYRKDNRLLGHLGNDYKVTMGFGLHVGWAIEGAIGSQYKIDASYLSPNVNMASRLEAACKQFGVHILFSEEIYELLTKEMQMFCRNVDRVTVKGSTRPIRLYTVDLNLDNITPPRNKMQKYKSPDDRPDVETKREVNLEYLRNEEEAENYNAATFINNKKQLREVMVKAVPKQFTLRFSEGLNKYLDGKWSDSKMHFNQALKYKSTDGPTNKILKYMKEFDFVAPSTWKNYRELTSK